MRLRYIGIAILAAVALFVGGAMSRADTQQPSATAGAVVKVVLPNGHGSGVSVGNGYIVTAGHVADGQKTVKIETKDGRSYEADVLWVNDTYDIAMLRAPVALVGAGADLDCRSAKTGESIFATGNPLELDFVTTYGRIAGDERELGPWKTVLVTDITTIPGQSGGPVFEADGRVIGITVGVVTVPGPIAVFTGFGAIVPASTVCMLMGQAPTA
jgi:serine protease Do